MVKVYSIHECPWCQKVKAYLTSRQVAFEEHNIEENEADREECFRLSGDLIVPVTTIDGKNFVVSFDKEKLDALLGLEDDFVSPKRFCKIKFI